MHNSEYYSFSFYYAKKLRLTHSYGTDKEVLSHSISDVRSEVLCTATALLFKEKDVK